MNALDVALGLLLLASTLAGLRTGLLYRAATFAGLLVGAIAAVWTIPWALALTDPPGARSRLIVVVAVFMATLVVSSGIAGVVGARLRAAVLDTPLRGVDRFGGALAGALGVLVTVWLLAPLASAIPGDIARAVRGSVVVGTVADLAPPAPDPLAALQNFVADTPFPEVFADLAPAPTTGPPPDTLPVAAEVVELVAASTVKVEVAGCGTTGSGSGWSVGPDRVVTNAHVVAGADELQVLTPDGTRLEARALVVDPGSDLALLQVPDLGQAPLRLGVADQGEGAATFGHPGGQDPLRIAPARVEDEFTARGLDIYGREQVDRRIVLLAASLVPGDSGSAVVDAEGEVVGVVFAVSPDRPTTAFALAVDEVRDLLERPRRPGETGPCR